MKEQGNLVNLSYLLANPDVLDAQAGRMQRATAVETMGNRGAKGVAKYGIYFSVMWAAGLKYPVESNLLRSGNFYWRYVDDVADNDRSLPERYFTRADYLQGKRSTLTSLFYPTGEPIYGDREDIMLAHYHSLAGRLGIDLTQESFDILDTIIFDEKRARERRVLTQVELDDYFELLDPACIRGALKVAREDCDPDDFHPLSMAVRTFFNLRDFPKDFKDGLINISAEDIERYEVDLRQLEGKENIKQLLDYGPIRDWYQEQTNAGLKFLDESEKRLGTLKLKPITNFVLWMHFKRPASNNLNKYAQMLVA